MITRNRSALVSALNKMALKDFHTPGEREKADELLRLLEKNNEEDKAPATKTSRTRKKLTAEPGKGIVAKKEEETPTPAAVPTVAATQNEEEEVSL